ncbi:MAG: hypothetical protein KC620_18980, partial [Myxococcales bacterium]|nr:hypothetical protein [Myxococcales bacterium]
LGGTTALESILLDAERIATLAAGRLDADRAPADFGALAACFQAGDLTLAAFLAAVDINDPAAVRAATLAVQLCADRLDALADGLAAAMAFGEASVLYLDVDALSTTFAALAAEVRGADLGALERLLTRLVDGLRPIIDIDVGTAPQNALDDLLTRVEDEVAALAANLTALDPAVFVEPLADGIEVVTGLFERVGELITRVTSAIEGALDAVAQVIRALPLDRVADVLHAVLDPITAALQAISDFIDQIRVALDNAARTATDAMGAVEGFVDGFKDDVDALFADAREFIEGVDFAAAIGKARDGIQTLADLIAKAQLGPYFDTAIGAIDTASDVVEAVPWSLLPESMKADVDAAVAPIKRVDVRAFAGRVEDTLGIGEDGFDLRPELEAALADVQAAYDDLIAQIAAHDPRTYLQQLDDKFDALAEELRGFAPDLGLEPIREAIDTVRDAVTGVDLDALLQPLRDVFDQINAAIDEYSPAALLQPLEDRVASARQAVIDAVKLDKWGPQLDDLRDRALALIDLVDPAQLEPLIAAAFTEIRAAVGRFPDVSIFEWLGSLLPALFGADRRIDPGRFATVLGWLFGTSGADALTAHTDRLGAALTQMRDGVRAVDVTALANDVNARCTALRPEVQALIDRLPVEEEDRARLEAALPRLDASVRFGGLAQNRDRYLTALEAAVTTVEALRRQGVREVDEALRRIQTAFSPAKLIRDVLWRIVERLGISGLDAGVSGVVAALLDAAPPARLAAVLAPLFQAVRDRIRALIEAVLDPVRDAIDAIHDLIDQISLQPLIDAIDGIVQAVHDEIAPLSPDALLGDAVDAFADVQQSVADFDPIGDLLAVLDALKEGAARLIEKLSAEALLESPLAIYDHLLEQLRALSIDGLLDPLLDQLDVIAAQVHDGLDGTVTSFERLQDALPSGGGGSQVNVAVEVV